MSFHRSLEQKLEKKTNILNGEGAVVAPRSTLYKNNPNILMGEEKVKLKREYKASSIQKVSDNWKLFVKGVGQFKRNSVSVFQEVMNRI